ncbi:hypothetical protein SAMN05216436_10562 [bacterium A37T11]|nr:hypothetical protein SAMN05216436_10562 [bacterium A37T11]
MALQQQVDQDIKQAMLAKDQARLRGLRAIKAALLLANTEKGASEGLTEEAEVKVLQKLAKQRKESGEIYQQQNRPDLYQIEKEELDVIESFLPKQLSPEEVEMAIKGVIAETGASGIKELGKVIGVANKSLAGKADGRTISEVAKRLLTS